MDEKDKDLQAHALSLTEASEHRAVTPVVSPSGSTNTEVADDTITVPGRRMAQYRGDKGTRVTRELHRVSDDYESDENDHGEPDVDYEDAESAVPSRALDRRLSKVPSPVQTLYAVELTYNTCHRFATSSLFEKSRVSITVCAPRRRELSAVPAARVAQLRGSSVNRYLR